MQGLAVKISEGFVPLSASLPTKQAWASYARGRWPENAVGYAQKEWDLTPGKARGLVYGQITQGTIDDIRRHPRGGLGVILTVEAIAFGVGVDDLLQRFIETERARIEGVRRKQEERDATLASMARRIAVLSGVGGAGPVRLGARKDG